MSNELRYRKALERIAAFKDARQMRCQCLLDTGPPQYMIDSDGWLSIEFGLHLGLLAAVKIAREALENELAE